MPEAWQIFVPTYVYELPCSWSTMVGAVVAGDSVGLHGTSSERPLPCVRVAAPD